VQTLKTRREIPADGAAIRAIHLLAFGTSKEANLVDRLRNNSASTLSMVAEHEGAIVGHVLLSPVLLGQGATQLQGLGLAPVGVLPHLQKQGIGSQLIRDALDKIRADGWPFVVVLGAPDYYRRFGFLAASDFGAQCTWSGMADAFMLLPLDAARVGKSAGLARYREEFDAEA
jgi:putative acetyltransferase